MKMNQQNPGGEVHAGPTMKGCEFGIGKGKGMSQMSKGGHFVTHASPKTSGKGVIPHATGKGLK